ncbi:MAG: peptide ABC transporter substrate-binding protein [Proteobacteria bacterium]|nr:peptide ABC transporter substrate-binding protein [Pseudomonadota bacterium]MDA1206304.1 peptide ABC transporter substrate-binding protein [Pseudomonadota bacterium]
MIQAFHWYGLNMPQRLLLLLCMLFAWSEGMAQSVDAASGTVKIAIAQEPPQLNSMKATDQVSIFVLGHVMEGLTRYDRRGNLAPGVAERWELGDTTAKFWLRKDAKWSNGDPVTAHDFVFAWRSVVDPNTASEYAFILYPVKNAEAINQGNMPVTALGIEAIDDHTLTVTLERPTGYFIKLTAFVTTFPVQEKFYQARTEQYAADAKDMLYNGAFTLDSWVHSASMEMRKNPLYWDAEAIKLNAIDADYITADTRARLNLFIDDKIAYTQLDGETYKDALNNQFRIKKFVTGSVYFLEYNYRDNRITRNKNLRAAIQAAFDPEEFVNKVLQTPGNLPGRSLFPTWIQGVEKTFREEYPPPEVKPDLTRARALLTSAKQELGLEEIPPLILLVSDSPTATKQAEYMQGMLKTRLGLDLKIDVQTFKQRLAKMTSGEFDIVGAGWGPDFDDIMTFGDLFASWNLNNRGRYVNPEYDRLVRVAMNSSDPKTRMDAMSGLQSILIEDAVMLPMYEQGVIYLQHPKLKGMRRTVIGSDPDFTYARIAP